MPDIDPKDFQNSAAIKDLYQRVAFGLKHLHKNWKPHDAQARIGAALLTHGKTDVFVQCGRNFGKTDLVGYLLWRYAWTFPKSENYYFAPYMKQAREILWASRRIQSFGPASWIEGDPNNTEMRIQFKNGSFIKLDGSDNVDAYRGVKPKGLSVFDEFKDFKAEFFEAYDPNRAAFNAPLVIIGTPPQFEGQFTAIAEAWKNDPKKQYFEFPSASNPHISARWLSDKKAELYARGEGDVWEREYEGRFVKGGSSRIFPMLTKDIVKSHTDIMRSIEKEKRRLHWFSWADPAGASTFAVLYVAINPYTKQVYILDEIYEQKQTEMTVQKIGSRILTDSKQLFDSNDWRFGYDEAETWFANEMLDLFGLTFEPTQKARNDKTTGLSLIKDAILNGKVVISNRCRMLYWEMDNYRKDDNGNIVKKHDHLIDCLRYILGAAYYTVKDEDVIAPEADEMWRGARIQDDFPGFSETGERLDDWDASIW